MGSGQADYRAGTLFWSDPVTWLGTPHAATNGPAPGANVSIPFGWNLVIDASPPPLGLLLIEGNASFSSAADVNLTATYIVVQGTGRLEAGSPEAPHPTRATIKLAGDRQTRGLAISNDLVLGSKVLAVINGGTLSLHGARVSRRWTRLAAPAAAGSASLSISGAALGWAVGQTVVVTSTTFNPDQAETRKITGVTEVPASGTGAENTTRLALDAPLSWDHGARTASYPGSPYHLDMRAEVALLDSNILVVPAEQDPASVAAVGGSRFGPVVLAAGTGTTVRVSQVASRYCGQSGLQRACWQFQGLANATAGSSGGSNASSSAAGGSYLSGVATFRGQDASLRLLAASGSARPPPLESAASVLVEGSVFHESYDVSTVVIAGPNNVLLNNLAMGTSKDMAGKSSFDQQLPATFELLDAAALNNTLRGNVAAGSHRIGFRVAGDACPAATPSASLAAAAATPGAPGRPRRAQVFEGNSAHSSLVSLVLADNLEGAPCTSLKNFSSWAL
ncbi:hypothetical protein MNEG_1125 [Monoraphidium neglectum]|uniref:G8 domain-containing protein n=1 Tax=Monoraphidium neglectum TaxID=145388 RepID=A0A0D2LKA9_9CHLO|nr:hypothetical protein MNEG_1125 [Monoraphidium neglectum]KIZ06824.1 hypothetical protein MNEG_1125 [Monoraphidium neglectum]|eukprot:XP_013905843.1 hypothetical protein MNEG_1125 [Monoraphidium neglectum]